MTYTMRILYVYNDPVWKCTQAYFGCQHLHQGFTAWLHARSRRQGPLLTQCFSSKAPQQLPTDMLPIGPNDYQQLSTTIFVSEIQNRSKSKMLDDIGGIGGQDLAQDRLISFGFKFGTDLDRKCSLCGCPIGSFTLTLHFKFQF